jgi:AbrB family looped-hinge helix DNA binding protein
MGISGTMDTMQTTIDKAGRVVIPKPVREAAGLRAGMPLDVRVSNGVVEIEPATQGVRLVRKGPLLVAEPLEDGEPLTNEQVMEILTEFRERRIPLE